MNTPDQAPTLLDFTNDEIGTHVRAATLPSGEAIFIANDVCAILTIADVRQALDGNTANGSLGLDDDEKGYVDLQTPGGKQKFRYVTESGFYALVFRSKKPIAQIFRKWVTSEVLPAIRRHGRFDPQAHLATLAAQLPPLARRGLYEHRLNELETEAQFVRKQMELTLAIPGQYSVFHWMLLNGWEPGRGECGRHSSRALALSRERGMAVGQIKEFEHCGQITRVSRTARTFDPEVLKEIIGEAA